MEKTSGVRSRPNKIQPATISSVNPFILLFFKANLLLSGDRIKDKADIMQVGIGY
ncbi:hypothetical protein M065_3168 [Bacteroides fragilis str. Korea 419]|nr:hypothetical protein M065_3168 [Bacteroides fragilis str. Korea 419]